MYISMKQCILSAGCLPFKGVLHIGAHAGEEGKDYQESGVRKVAWIEANPKLMESLRDKTSGLNLEQTYVNVCLSDVEEEIEFNVASNGQSSSILELGTHATMYPQITYTETLKMQAHRMDSLIGDDGQLGSLDFNFNDVDFLNLDVQGAELKVLKGFGELLGKKTLKAIYSEVNFEHVYKECCLIGELDDYLLTFGFKRILTAAPEGTWGDGLWARV